MAHPTHETLRTVNYADTDAGGVVYYARYLEYLEAGRMEYLAAVGCDAVECHRQGIFFAVRELHVVYRASARLGDRLKVLTTATEHSRVHVTFHAAIVDAASGRLLIESDAKCVCIDPGGKLLRLPKPLTAALQQAEQAEDRQGHDLG